MIFMRRIKTRISKVNKLGSNGKKKRKCPRKQKKFLKRRIVGEEKMQSKNRFQACGALRATGGDGQGGLACCGSWGCKESDTTERLN